MQRSSHSTTAMGALVLLVLALCSAVSAFVVPSAPSSSGSRTSPARSAAGAAAGAAGSLWLQGRGAGGSSSRLYARISEKPGDKADREQDGEQGLPFLGGQPGAGGDEVPTLTRQQEEVGNVCACIRDGCRSVRA